ncbi:cytidine deaminase [Ktedonospora formicarum]|uniref:Cytidine deaminase n=1 Tax=Ktedonospora formicarum TaxID=2778364 RepID=A0A8J3I0K6_9CHLR|nr:cytidine deaminase [Ktedonospora formicarum]GHO44595.1 cytidine deaminase [Ktedonospora formicarum]
MPNAHELISLARHTSQRAHAPYSHFHVGAALIADGKIYTGVNIESASYGLTLCAERSALATAISEGAKTITAIAVSCTDTPANAPLSSRTPCGACRQWMIDLAPDATVYIDGGDDENGEPIIHTMSVRDLLPHAFEL